MDACVDQYVTESQYSDKTIRMTCTDGLSFWNLLIYCFIGASKDVTVPDRTVAICYEKYNGKMNLILSRNKVGFWRVFMQFKAVMFWFFANT